jgi:hypothetical protein
VRTLETWDAIAKECLTELIGFQCRYSFVVKPRRFNGSEIIVEITQPALPCVLHVFAEIQIVSLRLHNLVEFGLPFSKVLGGRRKIGIPETIPYPASTSQLLHNE